MKTKVFHYCKRLLILYFVWFVINGVYILYAKLGFPDHVTGHAFLLLIRDVVLYNGFPSSWFLMASVISAFLLWCLTKSGKNGLAIFVSVFCYVICLLMTFYNFLVGETLNGVFAKINGVWNHFYISFPFALIYFMLGKVIAENESRIKLSLKQLLLLFGLLFICLVFEVFLITYGIPGFHSVSHTTYIMLPAVAVVLLLLCLKWDLRYHPVYAAFRKASTVIYCSHGLVLWLLKKWLAFYQLSLKYNFVILFVVTVVICSFLSVVIIKCSKKHKVLRYLY